MTKQEKEGCLETYDVLIAALTNFPGFKVEEVFRRESLESLKTERAALAALAIVETSSASI